MKVFKSILLYLLIAIGLLAAAVMVCCVILMLSPKTKILGYQYVSYKKSYVRDITASESATAQAININSNRMKINIVPTTNNYIKVVYSPGMSGFVKAKNSKLSLNVRFEQNQQFTGVDDGTSYKTLNIIATEPEGLLFLSSSYMTIYVPVTYDYSVINAANGRGGINYTAISSSKEIKVSRLYLKTTTADIDIIAPNADVYYISTTTGDLKFNNNNRDIDANITYRTNTGSFETTSVINGAVSVESEAKSVGPNISIKKVLGSFNFESPSGNVVIGEIGDMSSGESSNLTVKASNASFKINKIYGYTYVQPFKDNVDNIDFKINDLYNTNSGGFQSFFESGKGNITIGTLRGYSQFKTSTGNVKVTNAWESMYIYTYSGAINVTFNTAANPNDGLGGMQIDTTESNITVKNIKCKVDISVNSNKFTRSRNINLQYMEVDVDSVIDAYTHDVNIETKIGQAYTFITSAPKKNIDKPPTSVGIFSEILTTDSDYSLQYAEKTAYRVGYSKGQNYNGRIFVNTTGKVSIQGSEEY